MRSREDIEKVVDNLLHTTSTFEGVTAAHIPCILETLLDIRDLLAKKQTEV